MNQERGYIGEKPFANPRNAACRPVLKLQDSSEVARRPLGWVYVFALGDSLSFQHTPAKASNPGVMGLIKFRIKQPSCPIN